MKVLLSIKDIPVDSTVCKKTGEKEYLLKNSIVFYDENGKKNEIVSADGTKFLISKTDGSKINIVSGETEMLWFVSEDDLLEYLNNKQIDCD